VFRGSDAVRDGVLTPHQLRSSAWIRLRHDIYADARLDRDHALSCAAVALWVPRGAALAGPSAAYLYGVEHAAGFADPVHVLTLPGNRIEPQCGVRVHHSPFAPDEVAVAGGAVRTTPTRTAWDVTTWLNLIPAVTVIDRLLALGLVERRRLLTLARARAGCRGAARAMRAFDLADGRAQSPPESRLRIRLALAGLPRPVPQHPVVLSGGVVYHPDLAWPEFRVAVEYDGEWHADPAQLHRDRRRLNHLVAAGWIVLHVTNKRMSTDFGGVVREVRAVLRSRGWRG
jgi:hypothetical protein